MTDTTGIGRVAVIGAGTIGASWAAYFLAHGLEVTAYDPAPNGADFLKRTIEAAWLALTKLGLAPGADPGRVRFFADPAEAVEGADFVQENAPERIEVKTPLLQAIDAALPAEIVIASSTSGIIASRLQEGLRHPERLVIGHPFNPPHLIPLVEVVGGKATDARAIATAMSFYREIGKYPIEIRKEVPGHLANRLQAALWREAVHLVAEGVASVADIDAAIAQGPGLRWAIMGPHLTFHLAGGIGGMPHFMAHLAGPTTSWWQDLGNPVLTDGLKQVIVDGVAAEAGGRSVAELAGARDAALIDLLAARKARGGA
jgi:3-hydroxyacyl-CoA dehydrogenase